MILEDDMKEMGPLTEMIFRQGKAEGRAEGKAEDREEIERGVAKVLAQDPGISLLDAVALLGLSVDVARDN